MSATPKRPPGGAVSPGPSGVVGEDGPEILTSSLDGYVVPLTNTAYVIGLIKPKSPLSVARELGRFARKGKRK